MPIERIRQLLERYLNETCTEEERMELARWISETQDESLLKEVFESAWSRHQPVQYMPDEMSGRIMQSLRAAQENEPPLAVQHAAGPQRRWWWAAAAGLLLLGAGAAFHFTQRQPATVAGVNGNQRYRNEVQPGGNKALLTLADGTTIALDSAANGLLAQQGNASIRKLANGQLAYHTNGTGNGAPMLNTMSTPRGGQYQVILPDGTAVWLNAASSITYPAAFSGKERIVNITGEAYFEVSPNPHMPFRVKVNDMEVTVLGTHFNVNAYTQEPVVKTTLLQGAVKVSRGAASQVLQPGQQAQAGAGGSLKILNDVDTEEAVAWKNGYFQFSDADMPTVMRQLENWYDIQVSYEGSIPERSFGGGIQRSLPLTKVLSILEENDVKFRIEGRHIIVMK